MRSIHSFCISQIKLLKHCNIYTELLLSDPPHFLHSHSSLLELSSYSELLSYSAAYIEV